MRQRNPEEGTGHGAHRMTPFAEQAGQVEVAIALEFVAGSFSDSTRSARAPPLRAEAETSWSAVQRQRRMNRCQLLLLCSRYALLIHCLRDARGGLRQGRQGRMRRAARDQRELSGQPRLGGMAFLAFLALGRERKRGADGVDWRYASVHAAEMQV
jgi:hypothetical protein